MATREDVAALIDFGLPWLSPTMVPDIYRVGDITQKKSGLEHRPSSDCHKRSSLCCGSTWWQLHICDMAQD
jgi:hypothetical protein